MKERVRKTAEGRGGLVGELIMGTLCGGLVGKVWKL
jgi:hypothetical protein